MLDALADGATPEEFIAARDEPFGDLRVTVIDDAGRVTFDNSPQPSGNQPPRPPRSRRSPRPRHGITIRRHSRAPTSTISIRPCPTAGSSSARPSPTRRSAKSPPTANSCGSCWASRC
ncbi:MAG: hypothetical protein ACLRMJ_12165 [Alistipes finegoldii]